MLVKMSWIMNLKCIAAVYLIILAAVGITFTGCSYLSDKPEDIFLLSTDPMSQTAISFYLPVSSLYNSDKQLYLIAKWGENIGSENHTTRWEILDAKGTKVFTASQKKFTVHPNMYTKTPVLLSDLLKKCQDPTQLTATFYIDDKLASSIKIEYENKSINSSSDQMVVILPFIEETDHPSPWSKDIKAMLQNTAADAIYCEVSRISPDAVPHYVVEQKAGKQIPPRCLEDKACASFIKKKFGDNIYIYGYLSLQKVDLDASTLTVYVYNMRTGQLKRFYFYQRYLDTYSHLMRDLLTGVFQEKGMLQYMKKITSNESNRASNLINKNE